MKIEVYDSVFQFGNEQNLNTILKRWFETLYLVSAFISGVLWLEKENYTERNCWSVDKVILANVFIYECRFCTAIPKVDDYPFTKIKIYWRTLCDHYE